jgi:S1-C subfamily serine protease
LTQKAIFFIFLTVKSSQPSHIGYRRNMAIQSKLFFFLLMTLVLFGACSGPGSETINREVLAKVEAATVFIESKYRHIDVVKPDASELYPAWGTGFIIAREGLILTNEHVVASWIQSDTKTGKRATPITRPSQRRTFVLHSVTVRTNSGTPQAVEYPAQVLCTRGLPYDLALLRIRPKEELTSLQLISSEDFNKLKKTSQVWAVGFPLGRQMELYLRNVSAGWDNPNGPEISVRSGTITAIRHGENNLARAVEHSCNVEHGNSGGPLVDDKGHVLGIVYLLVGKSTPFAIPSPVVRLKFDSVLACRRDRDEGGNREKPRTLLVDPNIETAYSTVNAAADTAQPGDTIEVCAGTHDLGDFLALPEGVLIRGMGVNQTTLIGKVSAHFKDFVELSDLTLRSPKNQTGLGLSPSGFEEKENNDANYFHDLRIVQNGTYPAVWINEPGRRDLINCVIEMNSRYTPMLIRGSDSLSRKHETKIERIRFDDTALERGTGPCQLILLYKKASPCIDGSIFDSPSFRFVGRADTDFSAIRVEEGSQPRARGCLFRFNPKSSYPDFSHTYFAIDVIESGGEYLANHFLLIDRGRYTTAMMRLEPGPTTVENNSFRSFIRYARDINDTTSPETATPVVFYVNSSNRQFKGNLLDGCSVALVQKLNTKDPYNWYEIKDEFIWRDLGNEYIDSRRIAF